MDIDTRTPAGRPVSAIPSADVPGADREAFWQAWDDFFATLRRARGRAAQEHGHGLTLSQYRLLTAVAGAPSARCGELAELVGASPPTITRMLSTLERAEIIERRRPPEDRRSVQVELTAEGRRLLAAKQDTISAKRRAIGDSLSEVELGQAERLLRRLAEAIEAL